MRKIFAIAQNTFRESVRSKVLYSFFFFALFMVIVSTVFSTTTVGDHIRLLKDFGLAVLSLSTTAFVVVAGSALLAKELQRRTVFNILAKPVQRYEFILGKFLGLFATALTLVLLMGGGFSTLIGLCENRLDTALFAGYLGITLELLVTCACVIFFSSVVVTPMLSGLFTFGVFLAGRSVQYLATFGNDTDMPGVLRTASRILYWLLPHFELLNVSNDVVYSVAIPLNFYLWGALYALAYTGALLTISTVIFARRNFR
jgi:Cu-processing system permease protein